MARFTAEINIDNAAFEDDEELPRILQEVAVTHACVGLEHGTYPLRDRNGNTVGSWTIEDS